MTKIEMTRNADGTYVIDDAATDLKALEASLKWTLDPTVPAQVNSIFHHHTGAWHGTYRGWSFSIRKAGARNTKPHPKARWVVSFPGTSERVPGDFKLRKAALAAAVAYIDKQLAAPLQIEEQRQ